MSARAEKSNSSSDIELERERETLFERPPELDLEDPQKVASMSTEKFMALNREVQDREYEIEADQERRRKAKKERLSKREEMANVDSAAEQLVKDAEIKAMQKKQRELLIDLAKVQGKKELGPVTTSQHNISELQSALLQGKIEDLSAQMRKKGRGIKKRTTRRKRYHNKKTLKMRRKTTKKVKHHKQMQKSKSRRVKK